MVKKVPTPPDQYLITNAALVEGEFVKHTLLKFSNEQVHKAKLASRNFKSGFDFTDTYRANAALGKLYNMILAQFHKDNLHLTVKDNFEAGTLFAQKTSAYGFSHLTFLLAGEPDDSIVPYITKVNTVLVRNGITSINLSLRNGVSGFKELRVTVGQGDTHEYYKLLFYIPEIFKFMRNLSRKARFKDPDVKAITRFIRPSKRPGASTQRNGLNTSASGTVQQGTDISGGIRPAPRARARGEGTGETVIQGRTVQSY